MRATLRVSAALILGVSALAAAARADEEKVPLEKVPRAVMDAVKAKFPGATIKGAEKEEEDGKTTYEIALTYKGSSYDVGLKDDGTILEVEKTIATSDLPGAVSSAIKAKYPNSTVKSAEEVTKGEKVSYEVVVVAEDRKTWEVVLDSSGKVLETEEKTDKD